MLVISFITHKGGAGKSTLAFSTAVTASHVGETVAILDLDPQGASTAWAQTRNRTDIFVEAATTDNLQTRIDELKEAGYTLCVLDTAAEHGGSLQVIQASDLCIIPARPNVLDLRAGADTWRKVTEFGKPAAFLLNQCPPHQQIGRVQNAAKALQQSGALLSPMVSARVDFQDAVRAGLGVTEMSPSGQASREMRGLWTSIVNYGRQPEAPQKTLFEEMREAA